MAARLDGTRGRGAAGVRRRAHHLTTHQIKTVKGVLKYEARAGRLPIRNDESGEVRGYIFFMAYVEKTAGAPRPLTFIWNGGPTANSLLVHTEMFGPRRLEQRGSWITRRPCSRRATSCSWIL